jgi:hypothetical protein
VRVTGENEFHAKPALVFGSGEPVLVTKRGKVSGVYVPLDKVHQLPDEIRRKLAGAVGRHIAKAVKRRGVSSRQVKEDFRAYRRRRR